MAKQLHKKCPSCKFDKCWVRADKCEGCGFDFKLGRKPRGTKIEDIEFTDDDLADIPPVVEAKPEQTKKGCPDCKATCWHAAPLCEKCGYNFKTGESKINPQQSKRKKSSDDEEGDFERKIVIEKRRGCGCRPNWYTLERQPWMDDFPHQWGPDVWVPDEKTGGKWVPGGDVELLRAWHTKFMREMRHLFPHQPIHTSVPADYAEFSANPNLRAAAGTLFDLYGIKTGITRWTQNPHDPRLMNGEYLTETETNEEYHKAAQTATYRVTCDVFCQPTTGVMKGEKPGKPFVYIAMLTYADAEAHKEAEEKAGRPMSFAGGVKMNQTLKYNTDPRNVVVQAEGLLAVGGVRKTPDKPKKKAKV